MKDEYLFALYSKQEKELKSFFWNTNSTTVFDNDNIIVISDQIEWHKNRQRVINSIQTWAKDYFVNVDITLIQDLLKFSEKFVVDYKRHSSAITEFSYNFNEYCNGDTDLIKKQIKYKFSNALEWSDINDFKDKLFYKNRSGFSIQQIEKV